MIAKAMPSSRRGVEVFWGEIAPSEHLVQIYADDGVFLDSLERFVAGGLVAGDAVIVIGTHAHVSALDERLARRGIDLDAARATDQYLVLDAAEALSRFLVNGWPDERRFREMITDMLTRARRNGRRVRAFGEMVAIMWARGLNGATVQLEHLWHEFCRTEEFALFCAYPKAGFTEDSRVSLQQICAAHSRVIPDYA